MSNMAHGPALHTLSSNDQTLLLRRSKRRFRYRLKTVKVSQASKWASSLTCSPKRSAHSSDSSSHISPHVLRRARYSHRPSANAPGAKASMARKTAKARIVVVFMVLSLSCALRGAGRFGAAHTERVRGGRGAWASGRTRGTCGRGAPSVTSGTYTNTSAIHHPLRLRAPIAHQPPQRQEKLPQPICTLEE